MKIKNLPFRGNFNFLGLPEEGVDYAAAKAVILPVPYDSTTSYRSGTRDGPFSILAASRNVELYDADLGCEPLNAGIHTLPELEPDMRGPKRTIERVETIIKTLVKDGKFPVMLGGEHSLSVGPARILQERHPKDFCVLQLDAHADLREEFESTPFNHASVMRRIIEFAPLVQVGIRNISRGEMEFVKGSKRTSIFWAKEVQCSSEIWIPKILSKLRKKVYISIDLDVFDPSVMPSVGTPEPGGLMWYQVLELLEKVFSSKQVVGFDIMELCPIPGMVAPDFLAAKLVFKLLSFLFKKNGWLPKSGN
jgi:agmatinase